MEKLLMKVGNIIPDPKQPRQYFDATKMHMLRESIKKEGILVPLVVQENVDGKFMLIDGERRYRTALDLGIEEVPVIIEPASTDIERLMRQFSIQEMHEGWTAVEKAGALINLSTEMGLTVPEVCKLLSLEKSLTDRYTAFASLADQENFVRSEVPMDMAPALRSISNAAEALSRDELKKEFTKQDRKKLEARLISSIKEGEIKNRYDITRLKDAFRKEPKLLEKYLTDASATPNALFLEAGAQADAYLRNVLYQSRYLAGSGKRFLEQPNASISSAQLAVLKGAELILKQLISRA